MKRNLILLGLILGFFILGFIRDETFIQANYWLGYKNNHDPEYFKVLKYNFFFELFSYYGLYYFKFLLTLLFSVIYWTISLLTIWFAFKNKTYLKWATYFYTATFFASILIYLSGYLIFDLYKTYEFSRFIAGIIQSPMACMLLFLAFRVHQQKENAK
jgi:hypothetical protein